MWVTNLFPNKILSAKKVRSLLNELSWNPSLPLAIFHVHSGKLLHANPRMMSLLKIESNQKSELKEIESLWPFSNDHLGPPAVLRELLHKNCEIQVQAHLKNYNLKSHSFEKEKMVFISAELQRKGDLLSDKASRQLLFRVISHEVRTAVQSLRGYVDMLDKSNPLVGERIEAGIERLDKVVNLLNELRIELDIEEEKKNESAS